MHEAFRGGMHYLSDTRQRDRPVSEPPKALYLSALSLKQIVSTCKVNGPASRQSLHASLAEKLEAGRKPSPTNQPPTCNTASRKRHLLKPASEESVAGICF